MAWLCSLGSLQDHKVEVKVSARLSFHLENLEKTVSKLILVIDRIQCLALAGSRSAKCCLQILNVICIFATLPLYLQSIIVHGVSDFHHL
jgi:hypothetical protein